MLVHRTSLDKKLQALSVLGGEWILIVSDKKKGMTEAELLHLMKKRFTKEEAGIATDIIKDNNVIIMGSMEVTKSVFSNMFELERHYIEFFNSIKKPTGEQQGANLVDGNEFILKNFCKFAVIANSAIPHSYTGITKDEFTALMYLYTCKHPMVKSAIVANRMAGTPNNMKTAVTKLIEKNYIYETELELVKFKRQKKKPKSWFCNISPLGVAKIK